MYKSIIVLGLSALAVASPAWSSDGPTSTITVGSVVGATPTSTISASKEGWGTSTETVAPEPTSTLWAESSKGWTSTSVVSQEPVYTSSWAATVTSSVAVSATATSSYVEPTPTTTSSYVAPAPATSSPSAVVSAYAGGAGRTEIGMGAAAIMVAAAFL